MSKEGRIEDYLGQFLDLAVRGTAEAFPEIVDVKVLQMLPRSRELWCIFVYDPKIQELESRLDMLVRFWKAFSERREAFYEKFKKVGLGYITLYPLLVSKEKLQRLPEESSVRGANLSRNRVDDRPGSA